MDNEQFILDNHRDLCAFEMAEVLSIPGNYIYGLCKKLGVTPISKSQKVKKVILENYENCTAGKIAKELNLTKTLINRYARELGVVFSKKDAPIVKPLIDKTKPLLHNITAHEKLLAIINKNDPDHEHELSKIILHKERQPHFKDKYNQTGSELLDELRGIETTKRVIPTAKDARIETFS